MEIGPHPLAHDLRGDVHHVRVAHMASIDHVGHLHPRPQLVALHHHGEDADVRGLHVLQHRVRHLGERPRRKVLQDEPVPAAAFGGQLGGQRPGDRRGGQIGDQRHLLVRLDAQAGFDGAVGAGGELGGKRRGQDRLCLGREVGVHFADGSPREAGGAAMFLLEYRESAGFRQPRRAFPPAFRLLPRGFPDHPRPPGRHLYLSQAAAVRRLPHDSASIGKRINPSGQRRGFSRFPPLAAWGGESRHPADPARSSTSANPTT